MTAIYILLGLAAVLLLWGVYVFNQLVRHKNLVQEGWSGIDVQLKRRSNLIPNLIETVKGYMTHERGLLNEVTELRARAGAAATPGEKGRIEGQISRLLGNLFAVAENYPELKADQGFLDLQSQLGEIEAEIQLARRYYNGTTRNLNIVVESFPSNLVANMFKFVQAEYFEIDDAADRAVPQVSF
jgi:LemA protein